MSWTQYDELGRVTETGQGRPEEPTGHPVQVDWDDRGRITSITRGNRVQTFTYFGDEARAHLVETIQHGTSTYSAGSISFDQNQLGQTLRQFLCDQGDGDGCDGGSEPTLQFLWDAAGNLDQLTLPENTVHQHEYTPLDLLSSYEAPLPSSSSTLPTTTYFSHNLDRELTRTSRPDGISIEVVRDEASVTKDERVLAINATASDPDQSVAVAFEYYEAGCTEVTCAAGSVSRIVGPNNSALGYDIALDYEYDGPLVTKETWSGDVQGSVSWTYDDFFRLSHEKLNAQTDAESVKFSYDPDGFPECVGTSAVPGNPASCAVTDLNLIYGDTQTANGRLAETVLNTITETYGYNSYGEVDSIAATHGGVDLFRETVLARDHLGRITEVEVFNGDTHQVEYLFDNAGRLEEAIVDGVSRAYGYDLNGNRTSASEVSTIVYDDQDRLLQYGGTEYDYGANGELTSKTNAEGTTHYTYDPLGNLRRVNPPNGETLRYFHDGAGRRIGKTIRGIVQTRYLYHDALNPVAELDSAGNITTQYVYATRANVPDYMIRDGVTYRIISDHLGSPRVILNTETADVRKRIDYDEFGNITRELTYDANGNQVDNESFDIPFRFAGGLWDRDTGLVRFGARDYDALTGRWTAKDPIRFEGGQGNLYVYVGNDPINRIDPFGLQSQACGNSSNECFKRCMDGQGAGGLIVGGIAAVGVIGGSLPLLAKTEAEMAIAARLGAAQSASYSGGTSIISRVMGWQAVRGVIGTRTAVGIRNMFAFGSPVRGGAALGRVGVAGVTLVGSYFGASVAICTMECGL